MRRRLPAEVADRTFEAILFDWDGTVIPDRQANAAAARSLIEALCEAGVHLFVVSGTHVGNVDGQLAARPDGPGALHLCLNRGSEVFDVGADGPSVAWRREATDDEERALDRAAAATVEALRARGLAAEVVSQRLNRRKIDLIPEPAWADPPKARLPDLLRAVTELLHRNGIDGLPDVVDLAAEASAGAGLADPRITSDVKHVEIGLTDKSDSARWAAAWLATRGITGGLVLLGGDEFGSLGGVPGSDSLMCIAGLARSAVVSVGPEPGGCPPGVLHLPGGPERFLDLLEHQLERRTHRRVPAIDLDPAWTIQLPGDPASTRAGESLGALANGWAGTRGALEEDGPGTLPLFVVSGVYTAGEGAALVAGPSWTRLDLPTVTDRGTRVLDLRTGVLLRTTDDGSGLCTLRFVSMARPHGLVLRAEVAPDGSIRRLGTGTPVARERPGALAAGEETCVESATDGPTITVATRDRRGAGPEANTFERLAAWATAPDREPADEAHDALDELVAVGFDQLLAEHRAAWAERWSGAEVVIEGSPEDELLARFATFHLLCAAGEGGEAAVGARGLTGPAYGGHVFWDADVFVLPALAALRPAAARAMLEYRIRRLAAAQATARELGLAGARFPWESAGLGVDVTPELVRDARGAVVPIRTGEHEEHIVADVAWAAWEYAAWSGDVDFLAGPGRDLIVETARFWASRIRPDGFGGGHLYGVIGPDEYHEVVDDNAFTNVMARWNLRRAAELGDRSSEVGRAEATRWRELADSMLDGYDAELGLYEQFAGYWQLEPLLIADVAPPPVAADVLLGADRISGSQIIKQADVLMLHHLVPDEVVAGSLAANLAYYEPRTAHGSSLSPAIHAAVLARAGQPERALEMFRLAARLDLGDVTGTTAGGLHLATMGGVWQALAYGFLGLRPGEGALRIDPCLPSAWAALELRFRFRGQAVGVRAEPDRVTVSCTEPFDVGIGGAPAQRCDPPGCTYDLRGGRP